MPQCREAPNGNRDRVADPGANPVNEAAGENQTHGVRGLEDGDDVSIVDLAPSDDALQLRSQYSEHQPVHVVERGDEEQEGADTPAEFPDSSSGRYCLARWCFMQD